MGWFPCPFCQLLVLVSKNLCLKAPGAAISGQPLSRYPPKTAIHGLTLKFPELGAIDPDGMTKVPEPAQQGIYHLRIAQKIGPFVV